MFGAATARCTTAAPMNRQFCPPYVPDTPCQPFSLPTQTADSVLRSFAERTPLIDKKTWNVSAVQLLLGHTNSRVLFAISG